SGWLQKPWPIRKPSPGRVWWWTMIRSRRWLRSWGRVRPRRFQWSFGQTVRGGVVDNWDFHSMRHLRSPNEELAALTQFANVTDDLKCLGLIGSYNGGGTITADRLEHFVGDFCAALNHFSSQLDITAKSLDRFVNTMERLLPSKAPVVFVDKKS